jgi:hypothetical protein
MPVRVPGVQKIDKIKKSYRYGYLYRSAARNYGKYMYPYFFKFEKRIKFGDDDKHIGVSGHMYRKALKYSNK